ncbi:MAG: response regulator transcription factor [Acidobacteriia bacterium]|nr:response regulator transcription factor [Terriglobia bacterium]
MSNETTRVFLISNNCILSEGLRSVFRASGEFELTATCGDPSSLADCLASREIDIVLADVAAGATLTMLRDIRNAMGRAQAVLWGSGISPEFAFHAMESGVRAVIPLDLPAPAFLAALKGIRNGQLWFTKELMDSVLSAKRRPLTKREGQLVSLLSQGLKNKQLAYSLGITEGTIKVYLSRLFKKVGVNDRFQLALYALRNVVNDHAAGLESGADGGDPNLYQTKPHNLHSLVMPPRSPNAHAMAIPRHDEHVSPVAR